MMHHAKSPNVTTQDRLKPKSCLCFHRALAYSVRQIDQSFTEGFVATEKTSKEEHRIIGKSSGVSIALVIAIIIGIVGNLGMMATLNERVSGFGINLENQGEDLGEIKNSVRELTTSTRSELAAIRDENMDLRERVTKLEVLAENK